MLVILRENIPNLGRIGDVVRVADGYARNYLLPRNLVASASEKNVAELEHQKRLLEKKRQEQKAKSQQVADKLNGFQVTLTRRTGENDKLFGSVTNADVADALKAAGHSVDRRWIRLENPIKTLGVHPVTVEIEPEVKASVKVWVAKEE